MRDKHILDNILQNNKAQPVGWGYIDIIVKREFVENFIKEILFEGFNITTIGWWEYCKTIDTKNQLRMGCQKSIFYNGWFSEICFTDDFPHKINLAGNNIEK